jgi:hypothetical protein
MKRIKLREDLYIHGLIIIGCILIGLVGLEVEFNEKGLHWALRIVVSIVSFYPWVLGFLVLIIKGKNMFK